MKVFDEDGNYLGEFIEDTKEKVEDAFEGSWIWGVIFLLFIAPGWTILGIVVILLFKLISGIIKLAFKMVWWLIRLPFCLVFRREFQEF